MNAIRKSRAISAACAALAIAIGAPLVAAVAMIVGRHDARTKSSSVA